MKRSMLCVLLATCLLTSCSLFDSKQTERGEDLTRCEFPRLKEGPVTWGEFVLYAEEVIIALGDCGARIMYVDDD